MKTLTKSNLFNGIKTYIPAGQFLFSTYVIRLLKIPLILLYFMLAAGVNAETYNLTEAGAANAHLPESWNTLEDGSGTPATNFTSNGDVFIVPTNVMGVVGGDMLVGPSTDGADWSMEINGSLEIPNNIIWMQNYISGETIVYTTINVNNKIIFGTQSQIMNKDIASGAQGRVFNLNYNTILVTANPDGIIYGSAGSIDDQLTIYLSESGEYHFNGDEQTTNGLPANVFALIFTGTGTKHLAADVNSIILLIAPPEIQFDEEPLKSKALISLVNEKKSLADLRNTTLQLLSKELLAGIKVNNFNKGDNRMFAKSDAEPLFLHIAPGQAVNTYVLFNFFDFRDSETDERLFELGTGIKILADADEQLPPGSFTYSYFDPIFIPSATVQFYSNAFIDRTGETPDYKWQYFGIPFREYVAGSTLGNYKKYRWDETYEGGTNWKIVEPNETMQMIMGYAITQDVPAMYEIKGYLTNENIYQYILSYTIGSVSDFSGQNILANPYTASIPIPSIDFFNAEPSVAFYHTGSIKDWEDNSGGSTDGNMPGQYLNVPQELAGIDELPNDIQSMQGFLVQAVEPQINLPAKKNSVVQKSSAYIDPVEYPYISIPYPSGINQGMPAAPKAVTEKIYTRIDINGNSLRDKVWLFTEPNCTKTFDNGWDSRKIMGSSAAPQLYVAEEGLQFQVNSMDDVNGTFLGFRKGIDTEYTMTFNHHNTELAYPNGLYLIDLVAGKTTDISESGSTYTFVQNVISQIYQQRIPAELEVIRFKVVTSPGTVTNINNAEMQIKVFASDRSIIVDNKTGNQAELVLFDVAGKIVMRKTIAAGISTLQANLPTGAYIANVNAEKTNIKSSIIIK